jgi:hypothetical protein
VGMLQEQIFVGLIENMLLTNASVRL